MMPSSTGIRWSALRAARGSAFLLQSLRAVTNLPRDLPFEVVGDPGFLAGEERHGDALANVAQDFVAAVRWRGADPAVLHLDEFSILPGHLPAKTVSHRLAVIQPP